jgi:ABC-2 type transport system permease protein
MKKVILLLRKEWIEVRYQRVLWFSTLILPIMFVLLALNAVSPSGAHMVKGLQTSADANPTLVEMTAQEATQAASGQLFRMFFLVLPVFTSATLAAYSIVGEKTNRTLEPLLAAPIRVSELLLAKTLAALIPAVVVTWLAGAVFAVGMMQMALSGAVLASVVTAGWLMLLALTVLVSSRINDPRTAQSVTSLVLMPVFLAVISQLFSTLVTSPILVPLVVVILVVIAALSMWGAACLFQRGVILTRWV